MPTTNTLIGGLIFSVAVNVVLIRTIARQSESESLYKQGLVITTDVLRKFYPRLPFTDREELQRDMDEGLEFIKIVNH